MNNEISEDAYRIVARERSHEEAKQICFLIASLGFALWIA
jgi:hypothetical protein